MRGIRRVRVVDREADVNGTVRIFIACDDAQTVAARVLERSIRAHSARPLDIRILKDLPLPAASGLQRTGFSFYRFMVPQLAGYAGKAIYLDADMLVFGDIAEIWDQPFEGKKALCSVAASTPRGWSGRHGFSAGRQFSVMLLDCARLDWDIRTILADLEKGKYTYEQLMFECRILPPDEIGGSIPPDWNSLEHYEERRTKLLHYTVGHLQPWLSGRNPLERLWLDRYIEAVREGVFNKNEIERLIASGRLRPSLANAFGVGPLRQAGLGSSWVLSKLGAKFRSYGAV